MDVECTVAAQGHKDRKTRRRGRISRTSMTPANPTRSPLSRFCACTLFALAACRAIERSAQPFAPSTKRRELVMARPCWQLVLDRDSGRDLARAYPTDSYIFDEFPAFSASLCAFLSPSRLPTPAEPDRDRRCGPTSFPQRLRLIAHIEHFSAGLGRKPRKFLLSWPASKIKAPTPFTKDPRTLGPGYMKISSLNFTSLKLSILKILNGPRITLSVSTASFCTRACVCGSDTGGIAGIFLPDETGSL
ncbi:hypothetical protein DFH09DRAFT_1435618 [Mycena vulgaris]|nr:hypothetical protein DFH09DRAFT_1435618 [Mycena vulgaris]